MTLSQATANIGEFALLSQDGGLPPIPCRISAVGPLQVQVQLSWGGSQWVAPERLNLRAAALPSTTPQSQVGLYIGPLGLTQRKPR